MAAPQLVQRPEMQAPSDAGADTDSSAPEKSESQEIDPIEIDLVGFDEGIYEALSLNIPTMLKFFIFELFLTLEVCCCYNVSENCAF